MAGKVMHFRFEEAKAKSKEVAKPLGYTHKSLELNDNRSNVKKSTTEEQAVVNLKLKKSWDVVVEGGKSIPLNMLMMWLVGNSVQVFSIMMVFMLLGNPIRAILNTNKAFEKFEDPRSSLTLVKISYIAVQLFALSLGVYKCQSMGLLPTTTSDWLAFLSPKEVLENSFGGSFVPQ